ncbi:hypothetical protein E0Z10_g1248 [Xylaria hypoxylon]|uniref:Uncharacterized protein n=1 Tax=Xylaria hypoxylon TaxID=37992 RepID=A0A4Z0ZF51_9PEZI|nr:hypothetical protein E0Z10_g1248 [Xylaria hypoxylon]
MYFPGKAQIRDSPPGPGDEMGGVELSTMAGHSGPSNPAQTNKTTSKSSSNSSSYYSSSSSADEMDEDDDNQVEGEPEPDDPPVRDGGNATTLGFEFELLVAASRFNESVPEPHPGDGRWISENLVNEDKDGPVFKYTCRNKIIDLLLARGVSAHKTEELLWGVQAVDPTQPDFLWWDSLEYENPNQNDEVLTNWMGNWQWKNQKEMHYAPEDDPDPSLVPGLDVDSRYTRWSCTDDISIETSWPTASNYIVPPGSVPIDPYSQKPVGSPPDLYKWFGAEVVSSVLDYDNPQTYPTLKTACGAIRDAMRIHKPMAFIESGVHVHVGQQAGWTLLHLKKFATLWQLVEPSLFKLHRKDRKESHWCEAMVWNSHLARLVYRRDDRYTAYGATVTGPKRTLYETQMRQYIPELGRRRRLQEYFYHLWLYDTINELNSAMYPVGSGCVRWIISGNKLSDEPGAFRKLQTLEFRLMQGTLDADHIWKWTSILERLVVFARDSTADVYRNAVAELLEQELPDALGLNKDDMAWFKSRATDGDHFAYPENGEINWSDPFMIPGHGDTHNPPN